MNSFFQSADALLNSLSMAPSLAVIALVILVFLILTYRFLIHTISVIERLATKERRK